MEILNFILIMILLFIVLSIIFKKEKIIYSEDVHLRDGDGYGFDIGGTQKDKNKEFNQFKKRFYLLEDFLGIEYIPEDEIFKDAEYIKIKKTKKKNK